MILDSNATNGRLNDQIKQLTGKEIIDARRRAARIADVERVVRSMKMPLIGFKWANRYDAVYLGAFARKMKMPFSRLTKAVEFLDYEYRVTRHFYA